MFIHFYSAKNPAGFGLASDADLNLSYLSLDALMSHLFKPVTEYMWFCVLSALHFVVGRKFPRSVEFPFKGRVTKMWKNSTKSLPKTSSKK
jgi:hypothetical protein